MSIGDPAEATARAQSQGWPDDALYLMRLARRLRGLSGCGSADCGGGPGRWADDAGRLDGVAGRLAEAERADRLLLGDCLGLLGDLLGPCSRGCGCLAHGLRARLGLPDGRADR
jgi:hypothetical protein